jgi:hypothetical protein
MTPSRGRPPQTYIMKVSWPIELLPISSTKNLSLLFCFYLFYPNSLFQPPIMFSLHLGGGLRRSRWLCRPRTTLRRASPDGSLPEKLSKANRREFTHHPGVDGQTAHRWLDRQTWLVRPPALGAETLGPVSGIRRCVCAAKLSASTHGKRKTQL